MDQAYGNSSQRYASPSLTEMSNGIVGERGQGRGLGEQGRTSASSMSGTPRPILVGSLFRAPLRDPTSLTHAASPRPPIWP